ncbi:hypothetical protein AB0G04_36210 [Actinoplanes sp. NPDC023801]|uniref:hypothetical protein n=1 Tax=Actinoplanes sp. NPDC023801 TaxID=3154595 RepID=UPI0034041A69
MSPGNRQALDLHPDITAVGQCVLRREYPVRVSELVGAHVDQLGHRNAHRVLWVRTKGTHPPRLSSSSAAALGWVSRTVCRLDSSAARR